MRERIFRMPETGDARRETSALLANGGNRLLLIEASLVVLVSFFFLTFLAMLTDAFLLPEADETGAVIGVAAVLLLGVLWNLFLILPLLLGLLSAAQRMERDENAQLPDVFRFFGSGREYRIALNLSFGVTWRLVLTAGIVSATFFAVVWHFPGNLAANLCCVVLILAELAAAFLLCTRPFMTLYFVFLGEPVRTARRHARMCAKKNRMAGARYFLDYLPWILLSVLTLGVLFFADVLPRMAISYFRFCRNTHTVLIESKEIENR